MRLKLTKCERGHAHWKGQSCEYCDNKIVFEGHDLLFKYMWDLRKLFKKRGREAVDERNYLKFMIYYTESEIERLPKPVKKND